MTRISTVNLNWAVDNDHALVTKVAAGCDILGTCETRTRGNKALKLAPLLWGWTVLQDTSGPARSATAIAIRKSSDVRVHWTWQYLIAKAPHIRNPRMQDRYIRTAGMTIDGVMTRVGVVHFPLKVAGNGKGREQARARKATIAWVRRCEKRGLRWVLMGDFNCHVPTLAADLGARQSHVRGVIAILLGGPAHDSWPQTNRRVSFDALTDHAIVTVDTQPAMWPGKEKP